MGQDIHLAVRADGGPSIGFGHLVRTGALAREFIERGHRVTYLTRTPGGVEEVCPDEVEVRGLGVDDQSEAVMWVGDSSVDVVLTDSYKVDTEYQEALREVAPVLAVVVDDTRFEVSCDLLINGNVYASELEYECRGEEPVELLGTEYLMMRRPFRRNAEREFRAKEKPERALVTMGGSDVGNSTPSVVHAFDGFDVKIDIIMGPGFGNEEVIEEAVEETDGIFQILENPSDLPYLMFRADLAVSACGSTVYELLASKTPIIGIPQSENQKPIADALGERGAILPLQRGATTSEVAAALRDVWIPRKRKKMVHEGARLVDGRGGERVYHRILEIATPPQ